MPPNPYWLVTRTVHNTPRVAWPMFCTAVAWRPNSYINACAGKRVNTLSICVAVFKKQWIFYLWSLCTSTSPKSQPFYYTCPVSIWHAKIHHRRHVWDKFHLSLLCPTFQLFMVTLHPFATSFSNFCSTYQSVYILLRVIINGPSATPLATDVRSEKHSSITTPCFPSQAKFGSHMPSPS